jgi:Fic family protein
VNPDELIDLINCKWAEIYALRPLDSETVNRLNHRIAVELAWSSCGIEGNRLSSTETSVILSCTKLIRASKDQQEIWNHGEALKYITDCKHTSFYPSNTKLVVKFGSKKKLSVELIREAHKLLTNGFTGERGEMPGQFRIGPISTGSNSNYPPAEWVEKLMVELVEWANKKISSCRNLNASIDKVLRFVTEFHYRLVGIHPFWDGNGRTTRLFMCAILMIAGLPVIAIDPAAQWRYIDLLQKISKTEVCFITSYFLL